MTAALASIPSEQARSAFHGYQLSAGAKGIFLETEIIVVADDVISATEQGVNLVTQMGLDLIEIVGLGAYTEAESDRRDMIAETADESSFDPASFASLSAEELRLRVVVSGRFVSIREGA